MKSVTVKEAYSYYRGESTYNPAEEKLNVKKELRDCALFYGLMFLPLLFLACLLVR